MSIRGIESQLMVTRSTDQLRDVGAMAKRPELTQDQLAELQKAMSAHQQKKVAETAESEMQKIKTDEDGSNGGGGASGGGRGDADSEQEGAEAHVNRAMLVPASDNVIDIKI